MPVCPRCRASLAKARIAGEHFWRCALCDGRAAKEGVLIRCVPESTNLSIWHQVDAPYALVSTLACPLCTRAMRTARITLEHCVLELDACSRCRVAWFDRDELGDLRGVVIANHAGQGGDPEVRRGWKHLPLPGIELLDGMDEPAESGAAVRPWITWGVVVVAFLATLIAAPHPEAWSRPHTDPFQYPWRGGTLLLFLGTMIQPDVQSLMANLTVLLVVGAAVERALPRTGHAAFLALAALCAALIQGVANLGAPHTLPGLSGVAAAVCAFALMRLPRTRMALPLRGSRAAWPLQVQAWAVCVAWCLWLVTYVLQGGHPGAWAGPLAGVLVGIGAALMPAPADLLGVP